KKGSIPREKLTAREIEEIKKERKELEKERDSIYKDLEKMRSNSQKYYEIKTKLYEGGMEDLLERFLDRPFSPFPQIKRVRISKEQAEEILGTYINITESEIKRLDSILKQERPEALIEKYKEYPKVKKLLEKIVQDIKENPPKKASPIMGIVIPRQEEEEEKQLEKYKLNMIVNNNETKGLPVQFVENPTIQNMMGDVQHDPYGLGGHKPHMRVKAGKLPKANGGILITDELITIFKDPALSDYLLTALEEKKVRIGGGHGLVSGGTSAGIETEPVLAGCIIIGCANVDIRQYTSPKMSRRFKHKILFDANMLNTKENHIAYANFIAHEVNNYNKNPDNKEKIPHFAPDGVATIIEEGARFTTRFGNANKEKYLTNILDPMKDIVQRAGLKAVDDKNNIVRKKHVEQAAADIRKPALKEQIDYAEKVKDGTIVLHTKDKEIGYVNGLVVYPDPFKTEFFGFPARLEATASAGNKGLISITKESKLSGEVFTKSHEVIIRYFKQKYEQDAPQFYEAGLDFNQLYNLLEGDSASIATAVAYLSSFSNISIKQNIAVTGSMNQRGDAQAVGGINEKIEGFYRLCKEQGLTGDQGVIIPKANEQSLMLDKELIDDVKKERFHIYAISKLDDALEILTDESAEEVHNKVRGKLEKYSQGHIKSVYDILKVFIREDN
ncbi:MAG: AAA family ATPase, partial [Nanoarchaeota archaeon]|nr:AAA family ATPase [Nanoarchaeota archaeon]